MNLFKGLIDEKTHRVLSLFIKNPEEYYHINKASEDSKVPLATTFRIIGMLSDNGIIEHKSISKFKIYRLSKNQKTEKLRALI
jgi:hypothetical protein